MSIPLSLFYFLYLAFVAFYMLYTIFNVYHLLRFARPTFGNLAIVLFYLLVSGVVVWISWTYIAPIDWSRSLDLGPQPGSNIF